MSLSDSRVEFYRREGWLAPIDVMSESEAKSIADELKHAEATHPEQLHPENRNNAHLVFPFLADLAVHPNIVEAVASLLGDDITLASTVLFIKEANSGSFVSWHQDATYMGLGTDGHVTGWIALTPSTRQSGCVSVIPGSHRNGPAAHRDTFGTDNILTRGQRVDGVDESEAVDLELRAGQMSFHHPLLIHGSRPNRTDDRRIGVALQPYLGADVRPTRGEHHVMHVRGADVPAHFTAAPRPNGVCSPSGVAARRAANSALADVLYDGAEVRRRL